jgi:hypothetical protein
LEIKLNTIIGTQLIFIYFETKFADNFLDQNSNVQLYVRLIAFALVGKLVTKLPFYHQH